MRLSNSALFIIFLLFTLSGCDDQPLGQRFDFDMVPEPFDTTGAPRFEFSEDFYYYEILEGTSSTEATERDIVEVFYTARELGDPDNVLSSTYVNGNTEPARFEIGLPINIFFYTGIRPNDFLGLRRSIPGMKAGGRRTVVIPADMGFTGVDLIVDIELVEIVN